MPSLDKPGAIKGRHVLDWMHEDDCGMIGSETPAAARAHLIDIVKARSFQSGKEITLASGRTSTLYFTPL